MAINRRVSQFHPQEDLADTDLFPVVASNVNGCVDVEALRNTFARRNLNSQTVSVYLTSLYDSGRTIITNNANPTVITVENDNYAQWKNGAVIHILQVGTGNTTIQANTNVSVNVLATKTLTLAGQYAFASIVRQAANVWICGGDLEPNS